MSGNGDGWSYPALCGSLVELSGGAGSACLTLGLSLVAGAQRLGEPAAWITGEESVFFPPDAAEAGVDLTALVVVRAPGRLPILRAADPLLRSGAFGLVVVDLGPRASVPIPALSRLLGLARKHRSAVLFLTEKGEGEPSLGSLVLVRGQAVRRRLSADRFACEVRILKDKRRGPGWVHREVRRGPDGMR